jgi:hypothetical protein
LEPGETGKPAVTGDEEAARMHRDDDATSIEATDEEANDEDGPDGVLVDDEDTGLEAVEEDQAVGRREAPFAADPAHRVRPVGD